MPAPVSTTQRPRYALPLLGLLLLGLLGCNRGLWTPDEPREAEISREMLLMPSVIPTLNRQRFIEKPPLYYWVVAGVFRLTGGPSVLAARGVSVAAGLGTLALLFCWGASAHSRRAGLLAAFMLATSVQFMVSTHWVLIDPLLMLSTTIAAWAAWELLARRDSAWLRLTLYLALGLALWIKGLIGPVLLGAGLLAYIVIDRPAHWRRLRPLLGIALLSAAVAVLALAILNQGGRAALWEWAYVNHVQRLFSPGATGHRQPLAYYLWTLPYALLPWLVPLIEALRPAHWRRQSVAAGAAARAATPDVARYGALMSGAMLVLLSISASKRETYLLPVLPLLFIWLGIRSDQWWQQWQPRSGPALGAAWWLQVTLLCVFCVMAPLAAWIWIKSLTLVILAALLLGLLPVAALLYSSARAQRGRSGAWALTAAFTGSALLLALAPLVLNDTKDMGPFVRAVGQQLPPGQPVFAINVDETLAAEIPFYTGREVIPLDIRSLRTPPLRARLPEWVLLQDSQEARPGTLPSDYVMLAARAFGPQRNLSLWHRRGV